MISQVSNQPNFRGSMQYILKSSGAPHKISIETTPKDDMNMFLKLSSCLEQQQEAFLEKNRNSLKVSISEDGQMLSFTAAAKYFQEHAQILNPVKFLHDRKKEDYAQRLLHHNKTQSMSFSISKKDFEEAKKIMPKTFRKTLSKVKTIKERLGVMAGYMLYKIGLPFYYQKSIIKSLPKADHAKLKAFFKG